MQLPKNAMLVNKAFLADKESYSAFAGVLDGTDIPLIEKLKELGIQRIWIMGLLKINLVEPVSDKCNLYPEVILNSVEI